MDEPILIHKKELKENLDIAKHIAEIDRKYPPTGYERLLYPNFFILSDKYIRLHIDKPNKLLIPFYGMDKSLYKELLQYSKKQNYSLLMVDRYSEWINTDNTRCIPLGVWQDIDIKRFSVKGNKMRKLRYAISKFEKSGETLVKEYDDTKLDLPLAEMKNLMIKWAESKKNVIEHSVICMEELLRQKLSAGYRAFLTYHNKKLCTIIVMEEIRDKMYLMDQEFYDPNSAPFGHMEYSIANIIEILKKEKAETFSLGLTWYPFPFEDHDKKDPQGWLWLKEQNVKETLLSKIFMQAKTNYQFKKKFGVIGEPFFAYLPRDASFSILLNYWSVFYQNSLTSDQMVKRLATIQHRDSDISKEKKNELKPEDILASVSETNLNKLYETAKLRIVSESEKRIPQQANIAIIGLSGRYPGSENHYDFWHKLLKGKNFISEIPKTRWDHSKYYDPDANTKNMQDKTACKFGAFLKTIDTFDAPFFDIPQYEAIITDPQVRLALETVYSCVEDAGYRPNKINKNTGLFTGLSNNQWQKIVPVITSLSDLNWKLINYFDFCGPSLTISNGCNASMEAIKLACQSLIKKECPTAIVTGANLILHPLRYTSMMSQEMSSTTEPSSNPLGTDQGWIPSEGVISILLKPLAEAIQDSDHIYAVIKSVHTSSQGKAPFSGALNLKGHTQTVMNNFEKSGIRPDTVSYVEAGANGASMGDAIGFESLTKAFRSVTDKKQFCPIGSVKSNIGHGEEVSSLQQLTKVLLQFASKKIIPLINLTEKNPNINFDNSPFHIPVSTSKWETPLIEFGEKRFPIPRRATISSYSPFDIGHIILEEYTSEHIGTKMHKSCCIPISSETEEQLEKLIEKYIDFFKRHINSFNPAWEKKYTLLNIMFTLCTGRESFEKRVIFIAENLEVFIRQLHSYLEGKENKNIISTAKEASVTTTEDYSGNIRNYLKNQSWHDLAKLWVNGIDIDWNPFFSSYNVQRVSLPTYSFKKISFPIPNSFSKEENRIDAPEYDMTPERSEISDQLLRQLSSTVAEILKVKKEDIDPDVELFSHGFDSISLTKLVKKINKKYHLNLTPILFFEHSSLRSFSAYLLEKYRDKFFKYYHKTEQPEIRPNLKSPTFKTDNDDIAIIGISGKFPMAKNIEQFRINLSEGKHCITEIPKERWDWKAFYGDPLKELNKTNIKWGGFIEGIADFDTEFFGISPREAELMDPNQRLLMSYAWKVIEDAGYSATSLAGTQMGIFIGTEHSGYSNLLAKANIPIETYTSTGISTTIGPNRISYFFDFHGPSEPVQTACSSSLVAVHRAVEAIKTGSCDMAIAGGINTIITPDNHISFSKAGMLAKDGKCKTFSDKSNGYVRGEGVGMLFLKKRDDAKQAGDHIYGLIKATVVNHGGRANSLTAPSTKAQSELLKTAYTKAGIDPRTIGYIETHGTGTEIGDPIEIEALKTAFEDLYQITGTSEVSKAHCGLGSVKTNIGHLELAAGVAGVIKVLLQIGQKTIFKSLHCDKVNPYIKLDKTPFYISNESHEWKKLTDSSGNRIPRRAGISSFGFGGTNAHIIIEEYIETETPESATFDKPYIFILSAKNEERLKDYAARMKNFFTSLTDIENAIYTLQTGREAMDERIAFIVSSVNELLEKLQNFIDGKDNIEDFYQGNAKASKDALALFESDEELLEAVEKWIQREKYSKILRLWVKGLHFDWNRLYGDIKPQRISLPSYPFAKKRYWIDDIVSEKPALAEPQAFEKNRQENNIIEYLKSTISKLTKIPEDQLDIHDHIENYGFDSLMVNQLAAELENIINEKDTTVFYASQTINDLAINLDKKYKNLFSRDKAQAQQSFDDKAQVQQSSDKENIFKGVAIIGISGKYPEADNLFDFFENLKSGKDSISKIPEERWDISNATYPVWGGFVNNVNKFDHSNFNISFAEAVALDPEERLLLEQSWKCFENAGYNPLHWFKEKTNRVGVYIGASNHEYPYVILESNSEERYVPFTSQTYSYANRISYFFNLKGPSVTVDTACSSSLYAIFDAFNAIKNGICDLAVAGGVNLSLHPSKFITLKEAGFLASDGRCHAFSEGGDGYVPGDAIGLVLLKDLNAAIEDNDHILGIIKGGAVGNDGKTNGFTVPNPESQCCVIKSAIENSNIDPATISFVECHGTGTSLGDPIEISALTEVFSQYTDKLQFCPISSVKTNIGHSEAASGIAQLTKVILQLQSKLLFPNVMHSDRLNKNINFPRTPFYVQKTCSVLKKETDDMPGRAGISSFGAGGTNVHLIIEEYMQPSVTKKHRVEERYHIIPFSGDSKKQLYSIIKDTYRFLLDKSFHIWNCHYTIVNIAGTLQHGRAAKKFRLAFICKDCDSLLISLKKSFTYYDENGDFFNEETICYGVAEKNSDSKGNFFADDMNTLNNEKILSDIATHWTRGEGIDLPVLCNDYDKVVLPEYEFDSKVIELPAAPAKSKDKNLPDIIDIHSLEGVHNLIQSIFKQILMVSEDLDADEDFVNFGIDSIYGSRIIERLAVYYQEPDFFLLIEYNTINKLAEELFKNGNRKTSIEKISRDEKDEVGSIKERFSEEKMMKSETIDFWEVIEAYKKAGGELALEIKKIVIANDKEMEVILCGKGDPVVFLPPFNSSATIWINQILELSEYVRVAVIHFPGIGKSDWIEDIKNFNDLADVCIEIIDKLADDKSIATNNVNLVGWSFGGFLGQVIAVEYPDYVKKLILVSTTTVSWSSKEYDISWEEFSKESEMEFKDNYEKLPLFLKEMPRIRALYEQGKIENFILGTKNNKVIQRYLLMVARFRHLDIAKRIQAKTYLISGADDLLMPAKFAIRLHNQIKDSEYYEVKGGRHAIGLFEKDIVNNKLKDWLLHEKMKD